MTTSNYSLSELGFSAHFRSQLSLDELENMLPVRVTEVHRDQLTVIGENGQLDIVFTSAVPSKAGMSFTDTVCQVWSTFVSAG